MALVLRIVIGIAVFVFGFYVTLLHEGRSISEKELTKKEREFLEIHEFWFFISIMTILVFLFGGE